MADLASVKLKLQAALTEADAVVTAPPPPVPQPQPSTSGLILLEDSGSGASMKYFHHALHLEWKKPITADKLGETAPISVAVSSTTPYVATIPLARYSENVVIYSRAGSGTLQALLTLASRTTGVAGAAPRLEVTYTDGSAGVLKCVSDVTLDSSTSGPTGGLPTLSLSIPAIKQAVLRFERPTKTVASVKLLLTVLAKSGAAVAIIESYALSPQLKPFDPTIQYGIGKGGNKTHSSYIEVINFDDPSWRNRWFNQSATPTADAMDIVEKDYDSGEVLGSKTYCTTIMTDGLTVNPHLRKTIPMGDAPAYVFPKNIGRELDEVYFQYVLRFGAGWHASNIQINGIWHYLQNGKLPGITSNMDSGGNSGGTSDGKNSWSFRGAHLAGQFAADSPYGSNHGRIPVGWYTYNPDQLLQVPVSTYGLEYSWCEHGEAGILDVGKDYLIEQRVKVNTPGVRDGIVEAWINGQKVYSRHDHIMRAEPPYYTPNTMLAIHRVWMCLLIGGAVGPIPKVTRTYFRDWRIANQYIGPA